MPESPSETFILIIQFIFLYNYYIKLVPSLSDVRGATLPTKGLMAGHNVVEPMYKCPLSLEIG